MTKVGILVNQKAMKNQQIIEMAKQGIQDFYHEKATYVRYLGGGSYGRVFLFSLPIHPFQVVAKACLKKGMAQQEVDALNKLRLHSLIPVVMVYHVFSMRGESPIDFILMEYIPGKSAVFSLSLLLSSQNKKRAFALLLVENLAHYHKQNADHYGDLTHPQFEQWLDYYLPFAEQVLQSAKTMVQPRPLQRRIIGVVEEAFKYHSIIFEEPITTASLIHGDYNIANIIVDSKHNPIAIIDPLHTMWADKEYDLFQLRNLTGDCFHLYETYKAHYPTSKRVDIKCAFYALFHEVYVIETSQKRYDYILWPLVKRLEKQLEILKKERKPLNKH